MWYFFKPISRGKNNKIVSVTINKIIMRYVDQGGSKIVTIIANVPNVQENEMPLPL